MSVRDVGLNSMTNNHRYPWKWWLKDLPAPAENAPTVFSTFACGGGSSMGYKRAGYNVLGNCEIDPKIAEVYKGNLHPKYSYIMDIREFNMLDSLPNELYQLDVLDGSPPCSTFSMAGSREKSWGIEKRFAEGQKMQRLDDLFFTFLDTVEKLQPKIFVAENVLGIIRGNAKGYVNEIVRRAKEIGYDIQIFKLNAAFMGVPQRRERIFFIGNRMGYQKLVFDFNEDVVPFGDIRDSRGKDFANADSLYKKLLQQRVKTDTSIADIYERVFHKRSGFNSIICSDDVPCFTLPANGTLCRMCDGLLLTDNDLRNASTFPQDYVFNSKNVQFITGMSVPPSMMANIAFEIKKQWLCVDHVD